MTTERGARQARQARPVRTIGPQRPADVARARSWRGGGRKRGGGLLTRMRSWFARSLQRNKPGKGAIVLTVLVLIVCGGFGLVYGGYLRPIMASYETAIAAFWNATGLSVDTIDVQGRFYTSREELRTALNAEPGSSILDYDIEAARARVEALPWVDDARVMRLLPSTIFVEIVEKRPFALWQVNGELWLIEEDGGLINRKDVERFAGTVPLVVGEGAAEKVAELVSALSRQRNVAAHVASAVRVGGRRWDLILLTGARVKLPESDLDSALADLERLDAEQGLFAKDIESVDLRLPDRITVIPRASAGRALQGEDT